MRADDTLDVPGAGAAQPAPWTRPVAVATAVLVGTVALTGAALAAGKPGPRPTCRDVTVGKAKHPAPDGRTLRWVPACRPKTPPVAGAADLAVDISGPARAETGSTGMYTIDVHNVGTAAATAPIIITDALPSGQRAAGVRAGPDLSCTIRAPGATVVCTRSRSLAAGASTSQVLIRVRSVATARGSLVSTARVGPVAGETRVANNVDTVATMITKGIAGRCRPENLFGAGQRPAGRAVVAPGQLLTVVYSDQTPMGDGSNGGGAPVLTVDGAVRTSGPRVAATSGPGRYNALVSYRLPTRLTAGVHTVRIRVFDSDPMGLSGCATASWRLTVRPHVAPKPVGSLTRGPHPRVPASSPRRGAGQPDLSIVQAQPGSAVRPGDLVTWRLTVTNNGARPANGFNVRDTLPRGIRLTTVGGVGFDCLGLRCLHLGTLAPGRSATLTVTGALSPSYTDRLLVNTAVVGPTDATPSTNTSTATTTVRQPLSTTAQEQPASSPRGGVQPARALAFTGAWGADLLTAAGVLVLLGALTLLAGAYRARL